MRRQQKAMTPSEWESALVIVGTREVTPELFSYALDGYWKGSKLEGFSVPALINGSKGTGKAHFLPSCPKIRDGCFSASLPLRRWASYPKSSRCECYDKWDEYIPEDLIIEASILSDARELTRPWRSASFSSAHLGYTVLPYDNSPLTQGYFEVFLSFVYKFAIGSKDAEWLLHLHDSLLTVLTDWKFLETNSKAIEENDPHVRVLRWQEDLSLPALEGTVNQIRWAEQIRYTLAAENADSVEYILPHEKSARAWIALQTNPSEDLLAQWIGMKERELARLRLKLSQVPAS